MLLQQCHPNTAGSLATARRTEYNPHCFCCFLCVVGHPPKLGETAKEYRIVLNDTKATMTMTPDVLLKQRSNLQLY